MITNLRLSQKIPALIVGCALIVGLGVSVASYFTAKASMQDLTRSRLEAAADISSEKTLSYLKGIEQDES